MPRGPHGRSILRWRKIAKEDKQSVRAEQTVSEMVVEVLARQAEALSEGTKLSFDEAFAEVLKTPAGRQLGELADGPHRHERAARWQAGLLVGREAKRPAHLRTSQNVQEAIEVTPRPRRSLASRS